MDRYPSKIDLHIHTDASDGTDTPKELLENLRSSGIGLFSVTDHDAVKTCSVIKDMLKDDDPRFINGIELSCKDDLGKYHILGYSYDINGKSILDIVESAHQTRMFKIKRRIEILRDDFGISFPDEEVSALLALNNPGKPHIGNLMVKYGYAKTRSEAIEKTLNKVRVPGSVTILPEVAIKAILQSNGIPILAHPVYGDGTQLLDEDELNDRIRRLKEHGLMGVEAYYSGFSPKMQNMMIDMAERFDLLISAGSDYHGKNKMIDLGDTNIVDTNDADKRLFKFIDMCLS